MKTKTSKKDLKIALKVLREFKKCENTEEWFYITFQAWTKLEQLEEFLDHLVNKKPLKEDTLEYLEEIEASMNEKLTERQFNKMAAKAFTYKRPKYLMKSKKGYKIIEANI